MSPMPQTGPAFPALPTDATPAGSGVIETTNPGPPGDATLALSNTWIDETSSTLTVIWAGSDASDPSTGRVEEEVYGSSGQLVDHKSWLLSGVGAIHVTGASGETVTVVDGSGNEHHIDAGLLTMTTP